MRAALSTSATPPVLDVPGARPTDIALVRGGKALVYLVHGATGTPVEMKYTAMGLARRGLDVFVTTLPGHCRSVRELVRSSEGQWRAHVHVQVEFLRRRYAQVFAAGLSAGASLVLDAAADLPLDGIGVLSPTFIYDGWNTPWTNAILPWARAIVPYRLQHLLFHVDGPPFGLKDATLQKHVARAYSRGALWRAWWSACRPWGGDDTAAAAQATASGYPIFPLKTLTEVHRLNERVLSELGRVRAPAIILQAREDDMTSPRNAELIHERLGSTRKSVVLLDDTYHVITVDRQRKAVVDALATFFQGLAGGALSAG